MLIRPAGLGTTQKNNLPILTLDYRLHPWDNTNTCQGLFEQEATKITEPISLFPLFAPVQIPARRD
jgi:hypothetical protein